MADITVNSGQNIIDIALQYAGQAESIFEIAQENGLSLSEVLNDKQVLSQPTAVKTKITNYYTEKAYFVNTGVETDAVISGGFTFGFDFGFGSGFDS